MAGLEEFVGLGVTIALTDLFTEGAEKISEKFEELETKAGHGAEGVKEALSGIKTGLAALGAGGALLTPFVAVGDKAADMANQLEDLEVAYGALAEGGGEAFEAAQRVAEEVGKFPTVQVAEAGKQMLAMGVNSEKVEQMLRASSDAAIVFHRDLSSVADSLASIPFFLEQGMNPKRVLKQFGITAGDLAAEGIKESKGKITSSAEETMDAIVSVMEKKFGNAAGQMMKGMEGQEASFARHIEDFYLSAGKGGFLELKTRILREFNTILSQLGTGGFGEDIGRGALMFYNTLAPVGKALRMLVEAAVEFIHEHPALVSAFTAMTGIAGAALVGVGGLLILVSTTKVAGVALEFLKVEAEETAASVLSMIGLSAPELLGLAAAAGLLYAAWNSNFGGMRDTITRWADSIGSLVEGVVALFTSTDGGVGRIPLDLHDKLVDNGLWPVAKAIFLWGERIIEIGRGVLSGIGTTFNVVGSILSAFGSVITFVIDLIGEMIGVVLDCSHALGFLTDTSQTSLTVSKVLGEVIGIGVGIYIAAAGAVTLFSMAQRAWAIVTGIATFVTEGYTAAVAFLESGIIGTTLIQWGWAAAVGAYNIAAGIAAGTTTAFSIAVGIFNAVLALNPLVWIVGAIALFVAGVAAGIAYIDEFRERVEELFDIKPMRWLMKVIGVIPEGATDADIDAGMSSREKQGNQDRQRRAEVGRDGFFDRISDNATGVDYNNDQDYAHAQITDSVPHWTPGAGSTPESNAMTREDIMNAIVEGMEKAHVTAFVDPENLHRSVTSQEARSAERRNY